MSVRTELPQLTQFDQRRDPGENLRLLYEHQEQLTARLHDILRTLGERIGAPGQVQTVPLAKLADFRVDGPTVVVLVPDEAGGATLCFNDGTDFVRVQDLAVAS